MVEVSFIKTNRGFEEFHLKGHADYNPGNDIVCASISALSYALLGALDNTKGLNKRNVHIEPGRLDIEINPFLLSKEQEIVDQIFKTILIGLLQIEKQYPEHIKILQNL